MSKSQESAKQVILAAINALNRAIITGLKSGIRPELEILGESEEWPELKVQGWVSFPEFNETELTQT